MVDLNIKIPGAKYCIMWNQNEFANVRYVGNLFWVLLTRQPEVVGLMSARDMKKQTRGEHCFGLVFGVPRLGELL